MRAPDRERDDEDGTILLPVILLLLLIATAATAMTLQARTSLREASTRRVRLSLALAADAAVRTTALALASAAAAREAPPFPIDGSPQGCWLANTRRLVLTVQDEGGRVDLNKATADLLLKVLTRAGLAGPDATAMTDAIMARRDTGGAATLHGRGVAERPAKTYTVDTGGFAIADAMDGLPGLRAGQFERLRPLFTVANGSAGIDPAVASPAIRAVIPARELTSPAFEAMTTPSNHNDFTITAVVGAETGPRFQRQAMFRLDPQAGIVGRFTSWDAPLALGAMEAARDGAFCRRVANSLETD